MTRFASLARNFIFVRSDPLLACGEQTHFSALVSPAEKIFSRRVKQEPKIASALRRLIHCRLKHFTFGSFEFEWTISPLIMTGQFLVSFDHTVSLLIKLSEADPGERLTELQPAFEQHLFGFLFDSS